MILLVFKFFCFLQDKIYLIQGILARRLNDGIHPKKGIINYGSWFLEKIPPHSVVVDIGCGHGELVQLFLDHGHNAIGIEIDRRNVNESLYARGLIHVCDAMDINFDDFGDYSVVTMSNSLEHFRDRSKLLSNMKKILQKKGGVMLVRVPALERDWLTVFKCRLGISYFLDSTHFVEYSISGLERELEGAGFNMIIDKVAFGEIYAICHIKR